MREGRLETEEQRKKKRQNKGDEEDDSEKENVRISAVREGHIRL